MTNRDFFTAVSAGTVNDEIKAHAAAELKKLNDRNAKRAATPSKTAVENAPIMAALLEDCKANAAVSRTAADIGAANGISTAKASSLLRKLTDEGKLIQTEGKAGKGKGKVKFYQFNAASEDTASDEGADEAEDSAE